MMAAQFHLDVIRELEKLLPSFQFTVPHFVIHELENIQKRSRGKNRTAAAIALKISASNTVKIKDIPLLEGEQVDDALLRISQVLCTNDKELRRKAREKRIAVVYLRQRKYLAVDGYL